MQGKKPSDLELIKHFNNGSIDAFEELLKRHETKAFNLAMRYTRNEEDAQEVLQDVFTTLYRKLGSFQGKSAFSSWLYRIVVNASFMNLRKRKQGAAIFLEDLFAERDLDHAAILGVHCDDEADNRQLRTILSGAVHRLPVPYRTVFILRDIDGLTNEEVSELLDVSVPAVKSRLHRSRLMLRRKLKFAYREFFGREPDPSCLEEGSKIDRREPLPA